MTDGGLPLPRPTDGEAALAVTLDWLRATDWTEEFEPLALQPLNVLGAPDTLAEHLAAAGLRDWHDVIVAAAAPGQPLNLEPRLSWLMGQAALEIAVGADQPSLFRVVDKLQMLGKVSDTTLAAAICSRVADLSENYSFLARLRARADAVELSL